MGKVWLLDLKKFVFYRNRTNNFHPRDYKLQKPNNFDGNRKQFIKQESFQIPENFRKIASVVSTLSRSPLNLSLTQQKNTHNPWVQFT